MPTKTIQAVLDAVDPDAPQPKCLRPGIWRHWAPASDHVDLNGEACVWHVMDTCGSGTVIGQLLRWVGDDGEVGYEVRINGLEETYGICEVAAYDVHSINDVARVANNLRYEWELILEGDWTYYYTSIWPDEVFPGTE